MLLDPYPLSGFDDIDFDDAGIGPISLGGHLDELEMSRRRGSQTTTSTTTPVDDSESAFSGALETNVTASLGQTAFLRCRLKNSQHQVSKLVSKLDFSTNLLYTWPYMFGIDFTFLLLSIVLNLLYRSFESISVTCHWPIGRPQSCCPCSIIQAGPDVCQIILTLGFYSLSLRSSRFSIMV